MNLIPDQPAPALAVDTLAGRRFDIAGQRPQHFTQLVFYRGLHCPICKTYLKALEARLPEFEQRGVETIAISTDTRGRAEESAKLWELSRLAIGYGLSIEAARSWGLYVSSAIREGEPPLFSEPGHFLVRPDRRLYYISVQSMPFARASFTDILQAVDYAITKNYPARGTA
ncbi:MAG: peroxiredoxin [Rhodospirillales bacterium]|nr:peroxiredoxin [Rhodospirillales bacterium]